MDVSLIIHHIIMHYQLFGPLICSISKVIFTLLRVQSTNTGTLLMRPISGLFGKVYHKSIALIL